MGRTRVDDPDDTTAAAWTLAEWIASVFDLGRPLSLVTGDRGQTNPYAVLRLQTSQGAYAVKRFESEPRHAAVAIELAAWDAGFPMARPVLNRDGAPAVMQRLYGKPVWIRVHTWIDGVAYAWNTVEPKVSAQMGGLLARMHALCLPIAATQADSWSPLGQRGWRLLAEQARIKEVEWAALLSAKVPLLIQWEELLFANTVDDEPLVPSQRDLHPPNVLRGSDGTHFVIDWDAAGPVRAREDAAMFALVWATHADGQTSQACVSAFMRGYRDAGGHFESRGILDLNHSERSRLWWIAYNVRRHLDEVPGPNPWLPPALLNRVQKPDLHSMERLAALLRQA